MPHWVGLVTTSAGGSGRVGRWVLTLIAPTSQQNQHTNMAATGSQRFRIPLDRWRPQTSEVPAPMPTETILEDHRVGEIQTHLHLHKKAVASTRCAYCREPWIDGACPTKRDAETFLLALNERRRQANLGPVTV